VKWVIDRPAIRRLDSIEEDWRLETEVTGLGPVVNILKRSQRSSWTVAHVEEEDMKWINSAFLCKTEYENVTSYDITKPTFCSNERNLKIIGDLIRYQLRNKLQT
jgi:hypothetical protein